MERATVTLPGFAGPDAPQEADLYRCVHCGLCLSACPTYLETGLETESPRGRIALMRAVHEGRIGISNRVVSHWELCLQCRACEAVCPSGVPYGRLMERARAQLARHRRISLRARLLRWLVFRQLLPHRGRLYLAGWLTRMYQRTGLRGLAHGTGALRLLPSWLRDAEAALPDMPRRVFRPGRQAYPPEGVRRARVALLSGCVMPIVQGPTMEAAVRVLQRNGCEVVVPVGQACCGALNLHAGERTVAMKMARRNIEVFLRMGVDKVVVASAGCGSAMKEYRDLLKDDPQYAQRAEELSRMTVDITEFLVSLPLDPPKRELPLRVTYQDPCHLAHAQRIKDAPRQLLRAIPGLDLVEMEGASLCCGAAGTYLLAQRQFSRRLLRSKMEAVAQTGAPVVATANPGCMLQLQAGLAERGIRGRVCHVVELLDEAYRQE
ncbi:MAG: (Fe-S)-binding protein [Chloroflexi bacterium]|nr:(Fe-S)-binding protein [Chloroflexota bacterium]